MKGSLGAIELRARSPTPQPSSVPRRSSHLLFRRRSRPRSPRRSRGVAALTADMRKKGKSGGSDFERRPKPRHCCVPSGQPGQPHASIPFAHNEQLKLENAAILAARKFAAYTVRRASESSANPLSLARRDVNPSKFMVKEGDRVLREEKISRREAGEAAPPPSHAQGRGGAPPPPPTRGITVAHLRPEPPPYKANYRLVGGGRYESYYDACFYGREEDLWWLFDNIKGMDPDLADPSTGASPLAAAAYNGHVECARLMLEKGATVDQKDHEGLTPLHAACLSRRGPQVRARARLVIVLVIVNLARQYYYVLPPQVHKASSSN